MRLSTRELWTAMHGLAFGAAFLLAFAGGLVDLWGLRAGWVTAEGGRRAGRRLAVWTWAMAGLAWLTVVSGTYVVYPWYRAKPPPAVDAASLTQYPKYLLLSRPQTADWHEVGMEWKEHVAWFTPILATAVAVVVTRYQARLADDGGVRRAVLVLFCLAFATAATAGLLGAMVDKVAPVR